MRQSSAPGADDLFEDVSFSQASDFLQEFDFLQPDTGQMSGYASAGDALPSWMSSAGRSNALAQG